jgi:predicted 3-demethylubiquinone-9 3-methyltransferase (glyoxalase superfamily)
MAKVTSCIWYVDEAEEAANYYVSLLPDSRIDRIDYSVVDTPGSKAGTVLLVEFTLGGRPFFALNGGPGQEHTHAVSFMIDCADQAEVDRLWYGLSAGGSEVQCGWLKDRWGVSWQIVPEVLLKMLGDPDITRARRVMEAMMGMVKLDIAALEAAYRGAEA